MIEPAFYISILKGIPQAFSTPTPIRAGAKANPSKNQMLRISAIGPKRMDGKSSFIPILKSSLLQMQVTAVCGTTCSTEFGCRDTVPLIMIDFYEKLFIDGRNSEIKELRFSLFF
ncbi:MAG: hypothetical protein IKM00_00640 [Clostridia bacterium]|nr:hypothetical protein [Clostridia bacterium]